MSEWGREQKRRRDNEASAEAKYQKSLRNRGSVVRGEPINKKKAIRMCLGFLLLLIISIVVMVAIIV
jgi:hypothetical protein